jgi:hypothetical protein
VGAINHCVVGSVLMLCGRDGSRGFALKGVEPHGLVVTELELGLQVRAALIAVIIRITSQRPLSEYATALK